MPIMSHELGALCRALGLPKSTRSFTLHCSAGGAATVECEYYPDDALGITTAMAAYALVRQPDAAPVDAVATPVHFDTWMRERTEVAHAAYMARHSGGGRQYN